MPEGFSRVTTAKGQRLLGYDPQQPNQINITNTPPRHKQYFQQIPVSQTKYTSYNRGGNIIPGVEGAGHVNVPPSYPRNYNNLHNNFNEKAVINNNIPYGYQAPTTQYPVSQPYQVSPAYQLSPSNTSPNQVPAIHPLNQPRQSRSQVQPYELDPIHHRQDRKASKKVQVLSNRKSKRNSLLDREVEDQKSLAEKMFLGFWTILLILIFVVAMFFLIQHRQLIGQDTSGASVEDQGMDADALVQVILNHNNQTRNQDNIHGGPQQGFFNRFIRTTIDQENKKKKFDINTILNLNNDNSANSDTDLTTFMFPPSSQNAGTSSSSKTTGYMLPIAHFKSRVFQHQS